MNWQIGIVQQAFRMAHLDAHDEIAETPAGGGLDQALHMAAAVAEMRWYIFNRNVWQVLVDVCQ